MSDDDYDYIEEAVEGAEVEIPENKEKIRFIDYNEE